jgi:hypothetical protein
MKKKVSELHKLGTPGIYLMPPNGSMVRKQAD